MQKRLTLAAAALALIAIGLLPVLTMIVNSFYVSGAFSLRAYEALLASARQLFPLMSHSLLLSGAVTFLATVLGMPLGVLLARTDLPSRAVFATLLTFPLLVPPYVIAVAWFEVLGPAGGIGRFLPPPASERLSAAFLGFYGCAGTLSTAFMPIVMLLTMAYAGTVNPRLEHAGLLMSGWPNVLRRITLPLIAPAISFAAILVFLLTLGEAGVPAFLRYPVYPAEVLTQFAAFYDFSAATAAAIPLLIVTMVILALEMRFLHGSVLELSAAAAGGRITRINLGSWRFPLFGLVLSWTLITVALPFAVLLTRSASPGVLADAFSRAGDSILRSVVFAVTGATLLTLLGFFCGYLIHNRALPGWRSIDALALFLFTLPGTVTGIGLISLWNRPATNLIYATPAIVILGLLAQYALLPARMTAAILQRMPPSLERAAQTFGAGWFMTLRHIVVPLAKRGLIATWMIAYVFCVRDLGITMVVYPPGEDTLPVRILTLMANGTPSLIAALCVLLILVTLLPLLPAALWQARERKAPG
jgi:iron(III) transport system permease protein